MAAPKKGDSQLADASGNPLLGARQSNIADVAASTANISAAAATAITLTYTTDDPGTTADGAVTFADGDAAMSAAEEYAFADELESTLSALVTLTTELRTDHDTFVTDVAALIVAVNSILDVLEAQGFMVAT